MSTVLLAQARPMMMNLWAYTFTGNCCTCASGGQQATIPPLYQCTLETITSEPLHCSFVIEAVTLLMLQRHGS